MAAKTKAVKARRTARRPERCRGARCMCLRKGKHAYTGSCMRTRHIDAFCEAVQHQQDAAVPSAYTGRRMRNFGHTEGTSRLGGDVHERGSRKVLEASLAEVSACPCHTLRTNARGQESWDVTDHVSTRRDSDHGPDHDHEAPYSCDCCVVDPTYTPQPFGTRHVERHRSKAHGPRVHKTHGTMHVPDARGETRVDAYAYSWSDAEQNDAETEWTCEVADMRCGQQVCDDMDCECEDDSWNGVNWMESYYGGSCTPRDDEDGQCSDSSLGERGPADDTAVRGFHRGREHSLEHKLDDKAGCSCFTNGVLVVRRIWRCVTDGGGLVLIRHRGLSPTEIHEVCDSAAQSSTLWDEHGTRVPWWWRLPCRGVLWVPCAY